MPTATANFMDYCIGALPVALPLPPGHGGLDPVSFTDLAGLDTLKNLRNICHHASKWTAALLCNTYKWWGVTTLDVASLDIPDVFSTSLLTNSSYYYSNIFVRAPLPCLSPPLEARISSIASLVMLRMRTLTSGSMTTPTFPGTCHWLQMQHSSQHTSSSSSTDSSC